MFEPPQSDGWYSLNEVSVISEFQINEVGYHLDPELNKRHTDIEKKISSKDIIMEQEMEFKSIFKQLRKSPNSFQSIYKFDEEGKLIKIVRHSGTKFNAIMVPKPLVKYLLYEAHESMSHPGSLKCRSTCSYIRGTIGTL